MDLDDTTVNQDSLLLTEKFDDKTNKLVPFDIEVDETVIILKLINWVTPNTEYTLFIQPTIQSITGENLSSSIRRKVSFESAVTSEVNITSPADFEKLPDSRDFTCTWEEIGENLVRRYYLEIGTNNAFYNLVLSTTVDFSFKFNTDKLKAGQYYIRVRSQNDNEYGKWSAVKTFIVGDDNSKGDCICSDVNSGTNTDADGRDDTPDSSDTGNTDSGGPIVVKDTTIKILSTTPMGTLPSSLDIKFDTPIDITNATITVVREDF